VSKPTQLPNTEQETDPAVHRPQDRENRRVIHATCTKHGGGAGSTNLVATKRDGYVELDPHVTSQCVLTLGE
jgi:hypothetical protein